MPSGTRDSHDADTGAWLGALVIAYTAGILAVLLVAGVSIAIWGLYDSLEWVLVATGVLTILLLYRPIKGWWLWWLWAAGFVHRDGEDENAPR